MHRSGWHILKADADARIALGFREPVSKQQMIAAARSGEIDRLLQWRTVRVGEMCLVTAGTVHAIGPGAVLCEIQQNSDVPRQVNRLRSWLIPA
jgi:mannose-6-phosphate isomerase